MSFADAQRIATLEKTVAELVRLTAELKAEIERRKGGRPRKEEDSHGG